jgi:hypothetical protein
MRKKIDDVFEDFHGNNFWLVGSDEADYLPGIDGSLLL